VTDAPRVRVREVGLLDRERHRVEPGAPAGVAWDQAHELLVHLAGPFRVGGLVAPGQPRDEPLIRGLIPPLAPEAVHESIKKGGEVPGVEAGETGAGQVPLTLELSFVLTGALQTLPEVRLDVLQHIRVGQLLAEDRRDTDGELIRAALIGQIVQIYENYEFTTEVLVASVRNPIHVVEAARMGADVVTAPAAVIEQCFKHPLTDIGLERFLKDWEQAQAARV